MRSELPRSLRPTYSSTRSSERTLTLALPKETLRLPRARQLVGELYLADISVPAAVYDRLGISYRSPFSGGPIVRLV